MNVLDYRPKHKTLADLLPYYMTDVSSNVIYLKDGSVTKTFRLSPLYTSNFTDEDLGALRAGLAQALNQLPEGALAQFFVIREKTNADSDIAYQNFLAAHSAPKKMEASTRMRLLYAKEQMLQEQHGDGLLFQTRIYVTVSVSPQVKVKNKTSSLAHAGANHAQKGEKRDRVSTLNQLYNAYDALKLSFESMRFQTEDTDAQELVAVAYKFLNPDRKDFKYCEEIFEKNDLSNVIALSDCVERRTGLMFGRTEYQIGTLKTLPESSLPCLMNGLANVSEPFYMVVTILVLNQISERERLTRKQRLTTGVAAGGNVRDIRSEQQLIDIEEALTMMLSSGEKLLAVSFHVITADLGESS